MRNFWLENLKEINHLEDLGIDGSKVNLKETEWEGMYWSCLPEDTDMVGSCENRNEPSGWINMGNFRLDE
jgi:hypothetical protein